MSTSEPNQQPSFEAALEQLEAIVHELEDGRIGLNESLARYEQGVKLLRQCHESLEKAERRIELLTGVDADGNPITTPFNDPARTLEEKAKHRSRRRSASQPATPNAGAAPSAGGPDEGSPEMDDGGRLF